MEDNEFIDIDILPATSEEAAYKRTNDRIDDLISAMEGGGGGQAEVIDIRNGEDGEIYDTAGVAVRTQFKKTNTNVEDISIRSENLSIFNALIPDTVHSSMRLDFEIGMDLSNLDEQLISNHQYYVSDFIEIPQNNNYIFLRFYMMDDEYPTIAVCDENKIVTHILDNNSLHFSQVKAGENHFPNVVYLTTSLPRQLPDGKFLIVSSKSDIQNDSLSIGSESSITNISQKFADTPIYRMEYEDSPIYSTGETVDNLALEKIIDSTIGQNYYDYVFYSEINIDTFRVEKQNIKERDIFKFTLTEWDGSPIEKIEIITKIYSGDSDGWVETVIATANSVNETVQFIASDTTDSMYYYIRVYTKDNTRSVMNVKFEFYNTNEKTIISEFEKTKDEIQKIDNIIDINNNDIKKIMENIEEIKNFIGMNDNEVVGIAVNYKTGEVKRLVGGKDKTDGDDFNIYPMFGGRKRCNVNDDGEITAWYGDEEFTEDGTNGQVMVYQPVFWYKVNPIELEPQNDGIGYHIRQAEYYVSSKPRTGFKRHPLFYDKNGDEIDFVLLSAYEGCIYDTSEGQYLKNDEQSMSESEDKFSSISDAKPASGKTQSLTRLNVEKLAQNRGEDWHGDLIKAESANQLLMIIEMGAMNLQTAIGQGVVSVADTPANENNSIKTGATSELGNYTGQAEGETGKAAISYRGMENPWGNIFKFVYGVNIHGNGNQKGGIPYICNDFEFAESKNSDNYESAGFTVANENRYISAMGYGNEDLDWIFFASETTVNSSISVGDYTYVTANLNGYRMARFGGGWSNGASTGGFCWSLLDGVGFRSRSIGGRLVYVPTKQTAKHYYTNIESWKRLET